MIFIATSTFAQYKGQPWHETPWTFGTDNAANFTVGSAYEQKKVAFGGIPFWAYDIGEVDTLKRAGEDPSGELVAGQGTGRTGSPPGTAFYRTEAAALESKTLTDSDNAARLSPNFGGVLTGHLNRGVFNRSGAWSRYTCNFAEGNYKVLVRAFQNDNEEYAFWFRAYEKETMIPITPFTRYHQGEDLLLTTMMESVSYPDLSADPYTNLIDNAKTSWVVLDDIYSLSGDVVIEFSDPGPTEAYGESVTSGGILGEITFEYVDPIEDKFAPVAEVWNAAEYDDMDTIALSLSEPGTLYLVPKGTVAADIETSAISSMAMTSGDEFVKPVSELSDYNGDSIHIATSDAAGNVRITKPIWIREVLSTTTESGVVGDTIFGSISRAGLLYMVPAGTEKSETAFNTAIDAGTADSLYHGRTNYDTLMVVSTLADGWYDLYVVDTATSEISNPVVYEIGASTIVAATGVTLDQATLSIAMTETATLVATVEPANATDATVTWTSSDDAIATVANGVVTAVTVGVATITVTTTDGSFTATCDVTVGTVGIIDSEAKGFSLYPNPVSDILIIDLSDSKTKSIEIYNMLGLLVHNENVGNRSIIKINTSAILENGVYFVKIHNTSGSHIEQIIVQ